MWNVRRSNGTRRTKLRGWLKAQGRPCWICQAFGRSGYIDYSLPPQHPFSFEMDELDPVSLGGSPFSRSNVDATHRCCNEWRGNKTVAEVLELAALEREKRTHASIQRHEDQRQKNVTPPPCESVVGVTSGLSA